MGSHNEDKRIIPLILQKREGKNSYFETHHSILFFVTRSALEREMILPEPNLLGFYQSLAYLGERKCLTPAPSSFPVPTKEGRKT